MGLIAAALLAVFGLVAAVLVPVASKIIADDVKAWLPWITKRLFDASVARLPGAERERYAEEWLSHINDVPGELASSTSPGVTCRHRAASERISSLSSAPATARFQATLKRTMDLTVAIFALALFLPISIFFAAAIRLDGGPIFFRSEREGREGQRFFVYKFRTMSLPGGLAQVSSGFDAGQQVTRIGRFLRSTSFDEIPRLINVIRGDLSVIGPRPLQPLQASSGEGADSDMIRIRRMTQPGLVDPKDKDYVKNRSLRLDIKILVRSIVRGFFR